MKSDPNVLAVLRWYMHTHTRAHSSCSNRNMIKLVENMSIWQLYYARRGHELILEIGLIWYARSKLISDYFVSCYTPAPAMPLYFVVVAIDTTIDKGLYDESWCRNRHKTELAREDGSQQLYYCHCYCRCLPYLFTSVACWQCHHEAPARHWQWRSYLVFVSSSSFIAFLWAWLDY